MVYLAIYLVMNVLASVVSAFYYLRIVKAMYFDEAVEPFEKARPVHGCGPVRLRGGGLAFFLVLSPVDTSAALAATALFAN